MCTSSVPATPSMPATPTPQDPAIQARLDAERQRQLQAKGLKSTILTGPQGLLAPATTAPKNLIGE
jgi:hypothetical protein